MLKSKLLSATAAAPEAIAIEDVFSTWLYTGNGSTQTITNGIDLAGEGGLVWIKERANDGLGNHYIFDTQRANGRTHSIQTNENSAEAIRPGMSSFNANGFSLGVTSNFNNTSTTYASWTFRKAPRFFDVVTYTGDGTTGRQISHNLDHEVGAMILKKTSSSGYWGVYHRSTDATAPEDYVLILNSTSARIDEQFFINDTAPTSIHFTVGAAGASGGDFNTSGATYVAYLFAHDPLGPSGDGSDGLIACGSYTGNGLTDGPAINLGWEPQWLLVKRASGSGNWQLWDSMRGWCVGADSEILEANTSNPENNQDILWPQSSGFKINYSLVQVNGSGERYIYIAIRRGPMREPTSGTEVFAPVTRDSSVGGVNYYTGFPVDLSIFNARNGPGNYFHTRLTATKRLQSVNTAAEISGDAVDFTSNVGYQPGIGSTTTNALTWNFRRAPGFFDVVAYTGNGVLGRTVSHNLGVAPEMMIVKGRTDTEYWRVFHSGLPSPKDDFLYLNDTASTVTSIEQWNSTLPTTTEFSLSGNGRGVNDSVDTYIAYLFATLPGISKVGSYTGNGSSQTINCGFTGGARFVLIKRTDSTGDWYVWDTARGIVSGNDPHLSLNTTAAEVTSDDTIDPNSSGFIVNQVAATNVNVSSATYIYLAIA